MMSGCRDWVCASGHISGEALFRDKKDRQQVRREALYRPPSKRARQAAWSRHENVAGPAPSVCNPDGLLRFVGRGRTSSLGLCHKKVVPCRSDEIGIEHRCKTAVTAAVDDAIDQKAWVIVGHLLVSRDIKIAQQFLR